MQNIDHHILMYVNHVMRSHEVANEMNSDTILFTIFFSAVKSVSEWIDEYMTVRYSWNSLFSERISDR